MTAAFYGKAQGVVVTFDVGQRDTFTTLDSWIKDIRTVFDLSYLFYNQRVTFNPFFRWLLRIAQYFYARTKWIYLLNHGELGKKNMKPMQHKWVSSSMSVLLQAD